MRLQICFGVFLSHIVLDAVRTVRRFFLSAVVMKDVLVLQDLCVDNFRRQADFVRICIIV